MTKNVYQFKVNFKSFLFILAVFIILGFLWYTQYLVKELQAQSREFLDLKVKLLEKNINSEEVKDLNFFFTNIIQTTDYPIIYTDLEDTPQFWRNVDVEQMSIYQLPDDKIEYLKKLVAEYRGLNPPVSISYQGALLGYYYYGESPVIRQLRWVPFLQIIVVCLFIMVGYYGFSSIKKSEERHIWVGMAKETAHQLGTPLSAQIGWLEYLKVAPDKLETVIPELEKDVHRLQMITNRFSQIGSLPDMQPENLQGIIDETVGYFQKRLPKKNQQITLDHDIANDLSLVTLNRDLFSWVLENLIKNALDSLENKAGSVHITADKLNDKQVCIDVKDSGKGIPKKQRQNIFEPGYSTKKRGWGLGLSLAKRIVEDYHEGKLLLKESQPGEGSTFRIILNASNA
ncbi:MAG: sensor histidine kinase [Calditrichia bacterium]